MLTTPAGFAPVAGPGIADQIVRDPANQSGTTTIVVESVPSPDSQRPTIPSQTPLSSADHPAPTMLGKLETPAVNAGPVQVARMVDGIAQTEMHIGLRTQAFGNVEVHTVVRESQLGLTVGSEKGNLKSLLGSEVPVLQTTFREHDLRCETIRFVDNWGAGTSSGTGQQPKSFHQNNSNRATAASPGETPDSEPEQRLTGEESTKLSVLA